MKLDDFLSCPMWTWEDDDGEYVIPLANLVTIPDDYDGIFVRCDIFIRSEAPIAGMVSIRLRDQKVYLISFPDELGNLIDVPLQPALAEQKTLQINKVCLALRLETNQLFPLKFSTSLKLSDGSLFQGEILG